MIFNSLVDKEKKVAVLGLGYVGLPIALAFARHFSVIGFDINEERIAMMNRGEDPSEELEPADFEGTDILFTANAKELKNGHFFIVAVPTPVDEHKVPDLGALKKASKAIGAALKPGDYVVFESTVYPGCTEEDCIPILEKKSGLTSIKDFKVGYSPERIVPGDKINTIAKIKKVVAGCDAISLEEIYKTYAAVIEAGVFKAQSIKVAEAAKVIENAQRDLNISFINEIAIIFERMGINTRDVIEAAATKWNFQKYYPGLVGGHCIGVDPYYLTYKAKQLGYHPQVILSGRRINDGMPAFVAKKTVQLLIKKGVDPSKAKVLVLGVTFKENVHDIRNSKVADLVHELKDYSINVQVFDPNADTKEVQQEYGFSLVPELGNNYDAVIIAVNHRLFSSWNLDDYKAMMTDNPVLIDVKGVFFSQEKEGVEYWAL